MHIEVKPRTSYDVVVTMDRYEAGALRRLIGKLSINDIKHLGLTHAQAESAHDLFKVLGDAGVA